MAPGLRSGAHAHRLKSVIGVGAGRDDRSGKQLIQYVFGGFLGGNLEAVEPGASLNVCARLNRRSGAGYLD